ncbi:MAG: hypothetical protein N2489_04885 [Clostridia bacterium]|nr:hypothetical protein [Clostridia bacterium]
MLDFDKSDNVITKVFNPMKITPGSVIEFKAGSMAGAGLFRFKKIVEFDFGERKLARYLIYSEVEETECIFEVFPGNNEQVEAYVYELADTVPFSEDFLEVAGQRFLTTPDGNEYDRCVMPEEQERIDGIEGRARIYNIETEKVEKEYGVKVWDYQRDLDGRTEFLNIEMSMDTGLFKIFIGEMIENIFYKFYQVTK